LLHSKLRQGAAILEKKICKQRTHLSGHPPGRSLFHDSGGIEAEKEERTTLRWRSVANSHFQVDDAGIFHRLRINWSPAHGPPSASWGHAAGDDAPDPPTTATIIDG
jgi:hypothetical protein